MGIVRKKRGVGFPLKIHTRLLSCYCRHYYRHIPGRSNFPADWSQQGCLKRCKIAYKFKIENKSFRNFQLWSSISTTTKASAENSSSFYYLCTALFVSPGKCRATIQPDCCSDRAAEADVLPPVCRQRCMFSFLSQL